jgi:hypothetical protein
MRKALIGLALALVGAALPAAQAPCYPPAGQWARKMPSEVGMDAAKLTEAVEFMKSHETATPKRDFSDQEINMGKLLASMISPSHDLVVWRWSAPSNEGFRRVVAAITS